MERFRTYIEGVDCSGKTIIGKAVAQKAGVDNVGELFMCKDNPWNAESTGEVPTNHPLFIAFLYKAAIWDILHHDPTKQLMQISFVAYRSTAYQTALKIKDAPLFENLLEYIPKFGTTIILDASIEARQERLKQRGQEQGVREVSKNDALIFKKPELVMEMADIIKDRACRYLDAIVVDTTGNTVEESILQVYELSTKNGVDCAESRTECTRIKMDLPKFEREISDYVKQLDKKHGFPEQILTRILEPLSI